MRCRALAMVAMAAVATAAVAMAADTAVPNEVPMAHHVLAS